MTIKEKICAVLMPIGFVIVIGSVGAIECNAVSVTQGFIQAGCGLVLAIASAIIGGFITD
jgi:hypothetical protein